MRFIFALIVLALQKDNLCLGKSFQQPKAGCAFNLDTSSPQWPPHLINDQDEIILPVLENGARMINLDVGQSVTVGCLGTNNSVVNFLSITGQQLNPATCTANSNLLLNGVELPYSELGCTVQNIETLFEDGTCANGQGTNIRIGWTTDRFIPLFDMCHDKIKFLNYFSTNTIIGKSAAADDKVNDRPYPFNQAGYFPGLDVNTQYTQIQQTLTVASIVGSDALAAQYINVSAQYYLARGHMAPDGDFIDAASQDASYYFMNTAPQYQSFNNGNWKWLEIGVRKVATERSIDFTVYTGTFGVLTLADINGVQQEIYLAFDENNNGLIPAPKYFWKLVVDRATNNATAVVGINNPHLTSVAPEDIFCPDVCKQVPWVGQNIFNLDSIPSGYTFCCSAADLHKVVPFSPDLNVPLFV